MAYAMYARGFLNLYTLRGRAEDLNRAQAALDQLRHLATPDQTAWGLGFAWREVEADAAYAITTALCVLAYADHHAVTGDLGSLGLACKAGGWLVDSLPWGESPAGRGPFFAPEMPWILPNVTAMVGGALARLHLLTCEHSFAASAAVARDTVLATQDESGFWSYGFAGKRPVSGLDPALTVDAVHTGYVLDGCAELALGGLDDGRLGPALRNGFRFVSGELLRPGGLCLEKVVPIVTDEPQVAELLSNPRLTRRPLDTGREIVAFPQESRLWGYGALLGAAARALRCGALAVMFPAESLLSRLLSVHLRSASGRLAYLPRDPRAFPRHESHAVEGITAWQAAWRTGGHVSPRLWRDPGGSVWRDPGGSVRAM
ncbi:MAG: hypothetical protein ACYC91_02705 [Solirubrobacteraceae bacterium]